MSRLFEITGDDIAKLDDADLRSLIGMLCETDYRQAGLTTKGITWGGHQDAPDGGLDVVVRDTTPPPEYSFVPKKVTGFQVKKPDMSKSKIPGEMRPKGILRDSIKDLIGASGAYIIVSSGASVTESALQDRIQTMKGAVEEETNHEDLALDFYDRGRIATWVRSYPSLILWVRNRIGRELRGWRPYENWANPNAGTEEEYLLDDRIRIVNGSRQKAEKMPASDGIQELRSALRAKGTSVRLAGLSGVGKTRLAQALFDERIAGRPLDHSQVIYTDVSFGPDPDPNTFAEQLIADGARAVLIVDNCPPELHRLLTKTCSVKHCTISLLTIEYDVRDDLPEETDVFRMEPASKDLIENLIRQRFSHINQVDARRIADFSGGNARIAIALANTVRHGDTLSGLRDENLFERLFEQRHGSNEDLLRSAEVCSLVYSFEGTDTRSRDAELNILASLIDKKGAELYRDVSTIMKRELIQSRDVWRAVLPHAIANRLAQNALGSIPKDVLVDTFLKSGSERLIKSFSRRLSYLHDCEHAVEIVDGWLAPDGWLGNKDCNFNDFEMEVFRNVAPVSPEKVLEAIEHAANGSDGARFTSREHPHHDKFVRLLRHIAYDTDLFERCAKLICRYALSEKADENNNSNRDVLKSLFYLYLSGTHGTIETKVRIVESLISSDDIESQRLGVYLLHAALEAWHFSANFGFGFGARSRDYGYEPRTHDDVRQWYEPFIGMCTSFSLSERPFSDEAIKILSDKFRGLWMKAGMYDALEKAAKEIIEKRLWNEGWIAVRKTIRYEGKKISSPISERLHRLEELLRPKDLTGLARAYALSDPQSTLGLSDVYSSEKDDHDDFKQAKLTTFTLGRQVAQELDALKELLPDLILTFHDRIRSFGKGLCNGSSDRKEIWKLIREDFESAAPERRQTCLMEGFISQCAEDEPELYNSILDGLLTDKLLNYRFPIFQATSTIDERGVERLKEALDTGIGKPQHYSCLAWGRAHESISDDDLAGLLKALSSKDGGTEAAIEILMMRFHRNEDSSGHSKYLISVALDTLSGYVFMNDKGRHGSRDHELSQIAKTCLNAEDSAPSALALCQNLAKAIFEDRVHTYDYPELFKSIASSHPTIFLDTFIDNDEIKGYQRRYMFNEEFESKETPLSCIPDGELINWCEQAPAVRYPLVIPMIRIFVERENGKGLEWRGIIFEILDNAKDLEIIFDKISYTMVPTSWAGSRADIIKQRAELLIELFRHDNDEVVSLAKVRYSDLQQKARNERRSEGHGTIKQYEKFE